jgi:acid phosphatase (class A)
MMLRKYFSISLLLLVLCPAVLADTTKHPDYGISPSTIDLTKVLAPPPLIDSAAGKADVGAMLDAQQNRTPAEAASAQEDAEVSTFRFADAIGPVFTAKDLPKTAKLFAQVRAAESPVVKAAKLFFKRPRPFVTNSQIHPIVNKPPDFSYPSGHSTFAYTVAIILANMLPERAAAIFERAGVYAHNRVVGGVHYPTDVEAGRISGSIIDNVMLHNSSFQHDYKEPCAEVRRALGLQEQPVCDSLR